MTGEETSDAMQPTTSTPGARAMSGGVFTSEQQHRIAASIAIVVALIVWRLIGGFPWEWILVSLCIAYFGITAVFAWNDEAKQRRSEGIVPQHRKQEVRPVFKWLAAIFLGTPVVALLAVPIVSLVMPGESSSRAVAPPPPALNVWTEDHVAEEVAKASRDPDQWAELAGVAAEHEARKSSWIGRVAVNCAAYENAPNEIKKSEIFRANEVLLDNAAVRNLRGKLARLGTNQGGDAITSLSITKDRVKFRANSDIHRGSELYAAVSEMREGQCVIFSADTINADSFLERSQVCETDYNVVFTSIAACPPEAE